MKPRILGWIPILFVAALAARAQEPAPVCIAIYGLEHDHARGFIPAIAGRTDAHLVGIVESNPVLIRRYAEAYHLDRDLFVPDFNALLAKSKVDAVATFTSTLGHRSVVEFCAAHGIDVMMEKPMAVSAEEARAIESAATRGHIQVVVNYETTWYPGNASAFDLVRNSAVGEVHKIVGCYGHEGPVAIGCSPEFLSWLTDPVKNGGGALMDFGCYGADLVTVLMGGRPPTSVFAVTQNFQPKVYTNVEDEATVVLTYPNAQAIIEASWNWPNGRKDLEIYGSGGSLRIPSGDSLYLRKAHGTETAVPVSAIANPDGDFISYLVAVVRGQIRPSGLSSVETNVIVCEILDAAKESARTGRRVYVPSR